MDSSAYKSSFKRRRMHSRSCSNLEFIQRWQAATFFYSNIPLQMLHNSLIFFHFPVQKWILNWIWGFGNEPEQKSQRCWVIVIPASEWYLSERERENILPTALSFLSGKDEKSESNIFKIMWITPLIHKGARLLKVALIRVSANKQKFSRFRFSKAIWELRCRRYCKQTENYRKIQHSILERLNVFIPYLHSKSPKYPCRTKRKLAMITSQEMRKA